MSKILLTISLALCCFASQAQPWMPKDNRRIKLSELIEEHEREEKEEKEKKNKRTSHEQGKVEEEGPEYLFERWVWHQKQHLDQDGYIVSPLKTWEEWSKYLEKQKTLKARGWARTTTTPANWVFQGPDTCAGGYSGLGRVNAVAFHPTDPNIFYAGSSGGGTWKTVDGGHHWSPLYGNLPTLGVSAIVVNPLNPNTIYVATGDADAADNFSMGVVKSVDGGVTWNTTGLSWTPTTYMWCRSMVMNKTDTNTLLLATNSGMYITHNGGTNWINIEPGDYKQVLYHPTDTSIVYATNYTSSSAQVLRSADGGVSWTTVTSFVDAQRVNIAVTPAAPNIVKAIVSNGANSGLMGIYGSTDAGVSFSPLYENDAACTKNLLGYDLGLPTTSCGGQGWYDLAIAIDPSDANKVIIGGVNNYYSGDGGITWDIVTTWWGGLPGVQTVHADKHVLAYNPRDGVLYQGCDGGIYNTIDPLTGVWNNITNGMGITQFYRNAVAEGVPWCIGGAQDNGTKMMNNGAYTDLTGGDGMQCRIDYSDPSNIWYTATQNGNIQQTVDGGANYTDISSSIPTTSSGIWITPYIINPIVPTYLLVGIEKLYSSTDMGVSWTAISPQFSTTSNIEHIAMCPTDANYIYLSLENNQLKYSQDYGATWNNTSSFGANVSRIAVEPKNKNVVWVTASGYSGTKVSSYNTVTGVWTNRTGTLPNLPVNCIVIDSFSGTKYIGTDVAVFYRDTTMTDWALYNTNLPSVEVTDLAINYETNELWAATYGRGMWKSIKREYPNGISIIPYVADAITVAPNPNRGSFTVTTTNKQLFNQNATVRLISSDGRTLFQDDIRFDSRGVLSVNVQNPKPATYICEVTNGKVTARNRVVIY